MATSRSPSLSGQNPHDSLSWPDGVSRKHLLKQEEHGQSGNVQDRLGKGIIVSPAKAEAGHSDSAEPVSIDRRIDDILWARMPAYAQSVAIGRTRLVYEVGSARSAAINALKLFQEIQRYGFTRTLRKFNLEKFLGRPVSEIFAALTDIVCECGESIDRPVARDAWLYAILKLVEANIKDYRTLTQDMIGELYLIFIVRSIETIMYKEISTNGVKFSKNLDRTQNIDQQIQDYIQGRVRDGFNGRLEDLWTVTSIEVAEIVDRVGHEALHLVYRWALGK